MHRKFPHYQFTYLQSLKFNFNMVYNHINEVVCTRHSRTALCQLNKQCIILLWNLCVAGYMHTGSISRHILCHHSQVCNHMQIYKICIS